jgi:hypothetical protein
MNLSPVLWLAVVFVLSSPRLALAGGANDPDDGCLRDAVCRGHYDKAMKSYGAGRYEAALPEFQSAYGLRQMPWLLVNIGRTLHRLGRLEEAVQYYNNYEKASLGSDPETLKKVQEYRSQAQAALDATHSKPSSLAAGVAAIPAEGTTPAGTSTGTETPTPIYKKWWFWTIVGGAAAVTILGVGIGVGVSRSGSSDPIPADAAMYKPTF